MLYKKFRDENSFIPQYIPEGYVHGFQYFVCLFVEKDLDIFNRKKFSKERIDRINIKRNQIMLNLETIGISTRQGTHAVHSLGYYKNEYRIREEDFLYAYAADRLSIAFPLYVGMKEEDVDYIIEIIKKCVE